MCGVLGGVADKKTLNDLSINAALKRMKNRGPDDSGLQIFNQAYNDVVVLGHTRLSIIDLTSAGHQPMRSQSGRFSITYNGEIYNYKELRLELSKLGCNFVTNSDTEVLINAWETWGESCLNKLDGMYAFSIFDSQSNSIFCVRDPFGIKPLFFINDEDEFYFASDLDALFTLSSKKKYLDYQKAYEYLNYGVYDDDERTFYSHSKKLMPGELLQYDLNKRQIIKKFKWFDPTLHTQEKKVSFEEAKILIREQFLENIRLQLRSDVPIGITLSGGIDSSAIACAVRHIEPEAEINTFSFIANNSPMSEEKWVDKINRTIQAKSNKVSADGDDLFKDLDDLIMAQGEPFQSTSMYANFRVYKLINDSGIKVALDGQGADELLAGYRGYPVQRFQSLICKGELISLTKFLLNWGKWPGRSSKESVQSLLAALTPYALQPLISKLFRQDSMKLINNEFFMTNKFDRRLSLQHLHFEKSQRSLVNRLAISLKQEGLPKLLRHGDRNSMRFSVESRVPFLTIPFAKLALSMPEEYLISNYGQTKNIFREAMQGIVPDEILYRKDKIGFSTPEDKWLTSMHLEFRKWINEGISIPIFNKQALLKEFDYCANSGKFPQSIWRCINLIRWYQLNNLD